MAEELAFKDEAAAEYDRAFAHVTAHFMPFLLQAAHIAPGMNVLDIETGTGLSAEAVLAAVGPTGYVIAADVSPAMAEKARERLGKAPNASVFVEDGQALSFADCSFDVILCNLGLMFFPGAGPLRVSSRASPRRSRGRLGEYRRRALLQPSDQRNHSATCTKLGRGRRSYFHARRSGATSVSFQ